jgi:uncharacterized Rossmann fold enzyme
MFYKEWEPIYKQIISDFNFSLIKDVKAANILNKILTDKEIISINLLNKLIKNNEIFVFGAGPSLEKSILKNIKMFKDKLKISADGATSALMKYKIYPDILVTDLDGKISDQINANLKGSIAIIHAHGDNIDIIKEYVPKFKKKILGSTQTNPDNYDFVYNFGGFTDGDRAVFLAEHFNVKKINLIGFDFNKEIGKYSYPNDKNKKLKLQKLKWCERLIFMSKQQNNNIIFL